MCQGCLACQTCHSKKKQRKQTTKQQRELRSELAAKFRENLAKAGGSVGKRLSELLPKGKAKGKAKAKAQAGSSSKAVKKNTKKNLARKLGKISSGRKIWLKVKAKNRKAGKDLTAEELNRVALGQPGGSWEGKNVRVVAPGQTDLVRNSPAVVQSHYDSGLVCVQLPSGSMRTFPQSDLYLLTGKEKVPLPEKTPALNKVKKQLQELALTACGGKVRAGVKRTTLLESPELNAAWHELGFRVMASGGQWPCRLFTALNIQEMDFAIVHWGKSPGSSESREAVTQTRSVLAAQMLEEREAACAQLPIHGGGHWTLLTLSRAATPEDQAEPNKLSVTYRDSLRKPSAACLQKAHVALSFLLHVIGSDKVVQHVLPELAPSTQQDDVHSCGFYCLTWMEEDYREFRGEGRYRLPENYLHKAADLSKWFKNLLAASSHAKQAKAAALAKAGLPDPPPLADAPPAAPAQPAVPLPLPGAPKSSSEVFGCSRCKYASIGCLSCNPAKTAKWLAKTSGKPAGEPDKAVDKWAAFEAPPSKRKRGPLSRLPGLACTTLPLHYHYH